MLLQRTRGWFSAPRGFSPRSRDSNRPAYGAHDYMQASVCTHKIKYIFKKNVKSVTSPLPHSRSLDCSQNPKYACTDTPVLPLSTSLCTNCMQTSIAEYACFLGSVLVPFPIAAIRYPDRSSLRKEGVIGS